VVANIIVDNLDLTVIRIAAHHVTHTNTVCTTLRYSTM